MGYTRYWSINKNESKFSDDFLEIIKSCIKASEVQGVKIKNNLGKGKPKISKDYIELNGDKKTNNDCETFALVLENSNGLIQFCKTLEKPYDTTVEIILNLAKEFNYVTKIIDDGFINEPKRIQIATTLKDHLLEEQFKNKKINETSYKKAAKVLNEYIKLKNNNVEK